MARPGEDKKSCMRVCGGWGENEGVRSPVSAIDPSIHSALIALIRSEVEREMGRYYTNIMDEVDMKVAKGPERPAVAAAARKVPEQAANYQVVQSYPMTDWQSFTSWGQSEKMDNGKATYAPLGQDTRNAAGVQYSAELVEDGAQLKGKPSAAQMKFIDVWLETVEAGELDVYTCLALSNAFTNTPDTRKIWAKAVAVTTLQLLVPCIMVYNEFLNGLSIHPCVDDIGFRFIGGVLYMYSVYTMYNNADGSSRSSLSNMISRYQTVPAGYWLPLIVGEILNAIVAMILVVTLYQIFTHQNEPADLILNAVAVNFLGSIDSEFVNDDMKVDAIANFKEFANDHFTHDNTSTKDYDPDEESRVDRVVRMILNGIAGTGAVGAFMFMFVATALDEDKKTQVHHGARHAGIGAVERLLTSLVMT